MKNNAIKLVWLTTAYLAFFILMSSLRIDFAWLWSMLFLGQLLVVYLVYKVLTENYHSSKKFKDWYADIPKKKLYNLE